MSGPLVMTDRARLPWRFFGRLAELPAVG